MNTIPLTFSAVTGAALAALGALLASSGLAPWGLFAVGLGIVGLAFLSWASRGVQQPLLARQVARSAPASQQSGY